ncbi:MAG: hypothetical protein AAGC78_14150 [Cellvibrio sp.]|uniref:hypothetical protein n=1 Tax=Cellvibrio sp. TaxID=1965322 RepID=UPI0031A14D65
MNPATSKSKWKKNLSASFSARRGADDESGYAHEGLHRPKEKMGKRKFKMQREIDEYLLASY